DLRGPSGMDRADAGLARRDRRGGDGRRGPRLMAVALALALLFSAGAAPEADRVEIRPGSFVELAPAAAGARLLSERDVFVRAMGPFDRSARLKTEREVGEAEYLAFV